ncbi:MAG: hypothetical protein K6D94_13715 [Clostridiales bacterium]|nr:hypothetical protein [Clostridiales bacterium]
MKKILSFCLASLMIILPLVSCGENNEAAPQQPAAADTAAEETETNVTEEPAYEPEKADLEGFELVLLNYTPAAFNWANTLITTEEQNGEVLNDAVYQRTLATEDRLGCVIREEQSGNLVSVLQKTVAAGDHLYDVAMMFDASITSGYASGFLMPWNAVPTVNLENDYWDPYATELYNVMGNQMSLSGAFSLYDFSTRHCYVVNKTMLSSLMPDVNVYEDARSGKWTLDRLYELGAAAESDINGDSVIDKSDRHGITGSIVRHYSAMLAGAEVTYIEKTDDGGLRFAIPGNEYAISVLQKLVQLNQGNTIYYLKKGAGIGDFDYTIFHDSLSLFQAAYIGEVAKTRDMDDDIGIMPPPKYNESQERYRSLVEGGAQAVLPKSLDSERAVTVGTIIDAFGYYSQRDEIPAYIDVIVKNKYARDEDAAEMVSLIFSGGIYDLGVGAFSASFKNVYSSSVFVKREDAIASTTDSIAEKGQKEIDKFIDSLVNG